MKELKPFGDVPDKLSVQIKRSFVATRTYAQALSSAADIAKNMMNVNQRHNLGSIKDRDLKCFIFTFSQIRLTAECTAALTKMQGCAACSGFTEKPCHPFCVNVMKGCLQHYLDLDTEWDTFVGQMEKISERLLGPFNVVMVVEPINIKISEAIMNFQVRIKHFTLIYLMFLTPHFTGNRSRHHEPGISGLWQTRAGTTTTLDQPICHAVHQHGRLRNGHHQCQRNRFDAFETSCGAGQEQQQQQ
jgi:Glypican